VGYRYYDAAEKEVAWPFGFGLSYTEFAYEDLRLSAPAWSPGANVDVSVSVRNTGKREGAEVVQLYLGCKNSRIPRAQKELKGFQKIFLKPGEVKTARFTLGAESFAYYNVPAAAWAVEGGTYSVLAGASSRDIRLRAELDVAGDGKEEPLLPLKEKAPAYFALADLSRKNSSGLVIPEGDFTAVLGRPLPPQDRLPGEPYTLNSTFEDVKNTPEGKALYDGFTANISKLYGGDEAMISFMEKMLAGMPLRSLPWISGGSLGAEQIEGLLAALNKSR
jgi:beta-glucosidase